jgi:glycolate oxidase FAD binding subunit
MRIGEDLASDGLDRILEHDPGDLTCTVESGVRLSDLRSALAAAGQRLSLDPPGDPSVGALLARNLVGPLRHRFGAPRDLVLGATLVLGDGTIANAGGKVVKNVAGYDLARLVCGSHGRLAFIARASFRLHPLPKATRTLVVETEETASTAARLLVSQLQPSALDVLHPGRVAVLFEGSQRAVAAQLDAARALVGGSEGDSAVWEESRSRQAEACAYARFAPGELERVLAALGEAIVRPAAGVAYVREAPSDKLSQATESGALEWGSASDKSSQERVPAAVRNVVERIARELDPGGVFGA